MVKQKMRVAILTTSFPLNADSVSGIFVQRLVKNLPSTVQATVITPGGTSPVSISESYKVHCFRYASLKWQLLAHQPGGVPVALRKSIVMWCVLPIFLVAMLAACFRLSRNADIIHANWSVSGVVAGFVGLILGKPVITTLRGGDVAKAKNSRLYYYLLLLCLRSNSRLVTVSEAIYDLLSHKFPAYAHKIIFLPNGVDPELLKNSISCDAVKEEKIFNLIAIGSLISGKGVDIIIEAFGYLSSPNKFKLSIVGDGHELKSLKELVERKSLGNHVEFVGQIPAEQVFKHLNNADALVLASYSEGRPNVVLESFAAGIPVIASDIDGIKELVRDEENGMRFKPGNAEELASKIQRLQRNKDLQVKFAQNGRKYIIENNLLWEKVGQQYAELYEDVLGHNV